MPKADPLIRTKLRRPFIRPSLVARAQLEARVAEGIRGPLTLVIAPAGFGKTTLVAASIAGCPMRAAWLSLDRDDNHPGRFIMYLAAALQSANERIGEEAAQLLSSVQQAQPEVVLTSLVNDLDAANEETLLVLDDYQFITNPAVHAHVAFLLDHCPGGFHLLIATRSDPPLPLSRLRARGQLVELRAADLRFTDSEAALFLNEVMGLSLDSDSIATLEERTEGWVAGLQMAALSMRDRADLRGFIEGFSGTNRHILDYLLEETLAGQTPEIQQFLLRTSVLERLTAPLCDALLAHQTGELLSTSVLEYLERENLFVISLDDERTWFRYHHLFSDLLRARLQQSQPGLIPELHRRASAWFIQNNFILPAIQQLFAAGDMNQAADLIEAYGPARWVEGDPSVIQMAESLPAEMLIDRPKTGIYFAWLLIMQGEVSKALPLMNALTRHLAGGDHQSEQQWILTVIGLAQVFLGIPANIPGFNPLPDDKLLDDIPAEDLILRDTAEILYGMAMARRGKLKEAAELACRWIQREKVPQGIQVIPTIVPFLARVYLILGRLHAAASVCREYLAIIQERGVRFITAGGDMNVTLGEVLYEWNYLDEAEHHIRLGLKINEAWANIMTESWGLTTLARVLIAKGDFAGAEQVVEQFEKRLKTSAKAPEFAEDYCTLRVCLQLASGDLQSAGQWAETLAQNEDFRLYSEKYLLTLVRIQLAQGRCADVEKLIREKVFPESSGSEIARRVEIGLLRAAALAGLRRLPEALEVIESCLTLAEPEGYVRVFINAGEPAQELLGAYLQSGQPVHLSYAQKLLDMFPLPQKASKPAIRSGGLVEPLSERELEVLQLMALGKTNQEIAGQLIVASGTVKAHAASIYRKLDVANRTEAVARARQLGILP